MDRRGGMDPHGHGGHEGDPVPEPVRDRFADHAAAIVSRGRVPARDRLDVAEELTGHLIEAFRAFRAEGRGTEEAADAAIAALGPVDSVGNGFMVTYRGRLWASTIGQLLPVPPAPGQPPSTVVWLARFDRLIALFTAGAAIVLALTAPPVLATLGLILGLISAVILWLAAIGLWRRQVWAVAVSVFICLVNAAVLVLSFSQPGGGWNLSLNGLAGLILLVALFLGSGIVAEWVRPSRPISRWLAWPVGLVLIGWAIVSGAGARIPDPTQIGPSDIRPTAIVTCAAPLDAGDGGGPFIPVPTLDLRVTYDRVDLWPRGITRAADSWGDVIEFHPGSWFAPRGDAQATGTLPDGTSAAVDVSNWVDLPGDLSPIDGPDSIVAEIRGSDQWPGRTIEVVVPTVTSVRDGRSADEIGTALDGIVGMVRLHHLDRFTLQAEARCGSPVTFEVRG